MGFFNTKPPAIPKEPHCIRSLRFFLLILAGRHGWSLYGILKNSSGRLYKVLWMERGLRPGVETPDQPDEPDVLDAGDVVDGLGVGGLRRVRGVWLTC